MANVASVDELPRDVPVRVVWQLHPGRAAVSLGWVLMADQRYVIIAATLEAGRPGGILCIDRERITSWANLVPAGSR